MRKLYKQQAENSFTKTKCILTVTSLMASTGVLPLGIFLSLGLGKPEQLSGYKQITYSLHVSANTEA